MPSTGHSQQAVSKAKVVKVGKTDLIMSCITQHSFWILKEFLIKLYNCVIWNNLQEKKLTSASYT